MNLAYLHLVLNHIPLIGVPIALIFLIYGMFVNNRGVQRFALFILMGLAAVALPVFLTGEPAEHLVENLPGVSEGLIESHEEAAELSLVLTLLTSAVAFLGLWIRSNSKAARLVNMGVIGIASLAVVSLLYTANLGGKVRHTEFGGDSLSGAVD